MVMMRWLLLFGFVALLSGTALADEARRLRVEAAVLIQAAEKTSSDQKRLELLQQARGKLLELQEHHPSESVHPQLYLGGKRTGVSLDDLRKMIATTRLAKLDSGRLRSVLGRALSSTTVDENGWTDLHWAAALNLTELVEALLDTGANITAALKNDGRPTGDRLKRGLKDLGLNADFTRRGYTPLHMAAVNNAWEAMAMLISRGADINARALGNGFTPLHSAAWSNARNVAARLIAQGADVDAKTIDDFTPLHMAARRNSLDVAGELIARGADVNAKGKSHFTPLHMAAWGNAPDVTAELIAQGATVNAKAMNDWTPLHVAAQRNGVAVATELIARGADVNAKHKGGETPLDIATREGHAELQELFGHQSSTPPGRSL